MKTFMRHTKSIGGKYGFALAVVICCTMAMDPALCQTTPEPRYTLDEAVALVKQSVGGEVLRAVAEEKDDRTIYEIRVLMDDGLVRDLVFDAETGLEE